MIFLNSNLVFKKLIEISISFFSHLHSVLPANGAPVSRQRTSRVKEMYNDYVREQTLQNWKFWIVSHFLFKIEY